MVSLSNPLFPNTPTSKTIVREGVAAKQCHSERLFVCKDLFMDIVGPAAACRICTLYRKKCFYKCF